MKHEIASSSMYRASCTCGHFELSIMRLAALVYLQDHIDEANERNSV